MPDPVTAGFSLKSPFAAATKVLEQKAVKGLSQDDLDRIGALKGTQGSGRTDQHWNWHDTLHHAHADQFVVAKMAQTDLLRQVHSSLIKAQRDGWSYDRWARTITPQMQAAGWWGKKEVLNPKTGKMEMAQLGSPRRLEIIFRQNMRTATMSAKFDSMMASRGSRPLWRYVAVMDKRTRPAHAALHNLVFRWDHPFWSSHWPPNGWLCRCTVTSETEASIGRLTDEILNLNKKLAPGAAAETAPEFIAATEVPVESMVELPMSRDGTAIDNLPKGVHRKKVPVYEFRGVKTDPGWGYNPGQMSWSRESMLAERIKALPENLAKPLIDQMAEKDFSEWSGFVTAVKNQNLVTGMQIPANTKVAPPKYVMRWLDSAQHDAIRKALDVPGLDPFLATTQTQVVHAVRDTKNKTKPGSSLVPWSDWLKAPKLLRNATAIDQDAKEPRVIAITSPLNDGLVKFVFRLEADSETVTLVTAGVVDKTAMRDKTRWLNLWSKSHE